MHVLSVAHGGYVSGACIVSRSWWIRFWCMYCQSLMVDMFLVHVLSVAHGGCVSGARIKLSAYVAFSFASIGLLLNWMRDIGYLTLSVHAREGYNSHFVCLSVCLSVADLGDGGLLTLQRDTSLNRMTI